MSYGLLNTLYYTVAVSLAWVATGGGQSLRMSNELKVAASWTAAAKRFLKVRTVDRLASADRKISDPGYVLCLWAGYPFGVPAGVREVIGRLTPEYPAILFCTGLRDRVRG